MGNNKAEDEKEIKEGNLSFYRDGYGIASRDITDFKSLTPLFEAMQEQYTAISKLTQSFAIRVHRENKPINCEKGCSWCCYQPVYLTTQEAILIFQYMQQSTDVSFQNSIKANVKAKYKKTKGLPEEKKQLIRHACPFLLQGACSVYPVRPMACRIYLSSDKNSCKTKYDNPGNKNNLPALYDFMLRAGQYMNEGFVGFLKGNGKKMEEYTVEEFMYILFNDKQFAQKWLENK